MALAAAAWLVAAPPTADLAAHAFRGWLWEQEGFAVWNGQWYGGHHVPGYSLLFPPLAAWLGAAGATAAAGVSAAIAAVALSRAAAPPERAAAVAWAAGGGAAANLVVGRGPFALGVALAALALLAALRDRRAASAAAALSCAWASPVAAVFLCLAAVAWRRPAVLGGAVAGGLALTLPFPEGGSERFVATAFWPMLAASAAGTVLLRDRARVAAALYLALLIAAFTIQTPMGHNALRLGALAGPPLLLAAGRGPRHAVLALVAALVYLQWLPAVRAVAEAHGDPAAARPFHRPLLDFLDRAASPGDRVEVVFTRGHWEAFHVARERALARGWERQLDMKVNGLFYDGRLSAARYEAWLRRERIRWVALPAAPLDYSAREEARLLRSGPPFLRLAHRAADWHVWELIDPPREPVVGAGPTTLELRARDAGAIPLGRRHTPYWRVVRGDARVRERNGRLVVDARRPGTIALRAGP